MSFIRSTAMRASSVARCAHPARYVRSAELQPWRRTLQRRMYASAHGSHGATKKSDLPWMVTAVAATGVGLYLVLNQDLNHGSAEHHAEHYEKHAEAPEQEAPAEEPAEELPEEVPAKEESKDEEKAEASPDQTDEPSTRKEPKSSNEMSGKQEGLSNMDTKHTHSVSDEPEKSKKGEGVAESAKLKGTVSTERPQAENKEERGKAQQDKSQ